MPTLATQPQTTDLPTLDTLAADVQAYVAQFLTDQPMPSNLRQAIRYSLLGTGKRLRPILTMQACLAVGGQPQDAIAPAAAIEMIHCFSLVHDDLPAMDDDDLRRGRPSLHKHTNQAMAILAGDAMISLAFQLLTTALKPVELANQVIHELATSTTQMISGQVYDTLPTQNDDIEPIEQLRTIHRHKTGALIRCACRMGALCGQATPTQLNAITDYAQAVGLMFQVVDDLLDVTQTTQQLGKAANKDADKGKITYPGLIGIDATRDIVAQLKTQAHQALQPLSHQADHLRQLCDYMAARQK